MYKWIIKLGIGCVFSLILYGCNGHTSQLQKKLVVQASSTPQAEILQQVIPDLAAEGINLQIIIVDDYNLPNRALAEKEIDANFFQHGPFLEEQIRQFHYDLCILTAVHIEPMGIYKYNKGSLADLPSGSRIAVPNDPTNEARALLLLQKAGLITLRTGAEKGSLTLMDIEENPKHLSIYEIDAALLPRVLPEVGAAVIPTNYALPANLFPDRDALILEDTSSSYANLIAVRTSDATSPELLLLKKYITSEKVRNYIQETYKGAILVVDN